MVREGQIVLFRFPQTDHAGVKVRPALVVRALPGDYEDWLICMISSRIGQAIPEFDEIVFNDDPEFPVSGLRTSSVIRVGRLAVAASSVLAGTIGEISSERLSRIQRALAEWLRNAHGNSS